jgi:hypothetical protein
MKRTFTFKKIGIALAAMLMCWNAQSAAITGDFEKITSLADLTNGKYVVADATSGFAMLNEANGTSYIKHQAITVSNGKITNPDESIVWDITTHTDGGYVIVNGSNYAAYAGSGNSAYFDTEVTAKARWSIAYDEANDYFKIENAGVSGRFLQYNTSSPRFACYAGTQKNIILYKLPSNCTKPQLQFSNEDDVVKHLNEANFTNTATSQAGSTGTISYSSSNTIVADVNATTGEVTIKHAGITNIIASIAAVGAFCDASASYQLEVLPALGNEKDYILITSVAGLIADAQYIIVGKRITAATEEAPEIVQYYALGWQGTNNRTAIEVTEDNNTISVEPASEVFTGDVYYPYEITLKALTTPIEGQWALYDDLNAKYLTPVNGTGGNYLRLNDTEIAWSLTFTEGVLSIIGQEGIGTGDLARATFQFNQGSDVNNPLFSCYASASQKPIYLYKKDNKTDIKSVSTTVSVYATSNNIIINSLNTSANIAVYDITGKLIRQTTATSIPVTQKGIYIVKVNGQAFKVLNK